MNDFYDFSEYPFTADDLRRVCAAYAAELVALVETLPDPEFEPSVAHRNAIQRMIDRSYRKGRRHVFYRRAATVAAVIVILFSTILATNVHARETIVHWLRQVFPDHVLYQFFGEPVDDLHQYTIGWIPEGFELTEYGSDETEYYVYEKNSEMVIIEFRKGGTVEYTDFSGFEDSSMMDMVINGKETFIYQDLSGNEVNLTIFDQEYNMLIELDTNIGFEQTVKIAEGIH